MQKHDISIIIRKIKTQSYKIADFVYLLKGKKKPKFDDEYIGPYEIIELLVSRLDSTENVNGRVDGLKKEIREFY